VPRTSFLHPCSSSYKPAKLPLSRVPHGQQSKGCHGLLHGLWWLQHWNHGLGLLIQGLELLITWFILLLIKNASHGYITYVCIYMCVHICKFGKKWPDSKNQSNLTRKFWILNTNFLTWTQNKANPKNPQISELNSNLPTWPEHCILNSMVNHFCRTVQGDNIQLLYFFTN